MSESAAISDETVPLLLPPSSVGSLTDHHHHHHLSSSCDQQNDNSRTGGGDTSLVGGTGALSAALWSINTRMLSWFILVSLLYLIGLGHVLIYKLSSLSGNKDVEVNSSFQLPQELVATSLLSDTSRTSNLPSPPLGAAAATAPAAAAEVLIVYGPPDDPWQKEMALAVLEGCESVALTTATSSSEKAPSSLRIVCKLLTTATATFQDDIQQASAIIVGSSVENANTHYRVQQWIDQQWDIVTMKPNKIGAAFVTAGGISAGQEGTLKRLLESMMIFRMMVVGGETWESPFGVAAITGEPPFTTTPPDNNSSSFFPPECYLSPGEIVSPMFIEQAKGLGRRVASIITEAILPWHNNKSP